MICIISSFHRKILTFILTSIHTCHWSNDILTTYLTSFNFRDYAKRKLFLIIFTIYYFCIPALLTIQNHKYNRITGNEIL